MVQNFWTVACLATCLLIAVSASPQGRIMGGEATTNGQFPWVVSVRVNNIHTCGGTIISNKHIVTAGHCVSQQLALALPTNIVNVRVGSFNQFSGGKIMAVEKITIHPSMGSFSNDIAILTLTSELTFTTKIQKVDFATTDTVLEDDTPINVIGWGASQAGGAIPFKLQQATYAVYNPQLCELDVGYGYEWALCLKHDVGKGICTGDDGAGVMDNSKLVGVASFAFGACGTEFPDIAMRVSYYSAWIKQVIGQ